MVCTDGDFPSNLPFSSRRLNGAENLKWMIPIQSFSGIRRSYSFDFLWKGGIYNSCVRAYVPVHTLLWVEVTKQEHLLKICQLVWEDVAPTHCVQ